MDRRTELEMENLSDTREMVIVLRRILEDLESGKVVRAALDLQNLVHNLEQVSDPSADSRSLVGIQDA
jgi:hypothetical protein